MVARTSHEPQATAWLATLSAKSKLVRSLVAEQLLSVDINARLGALRLLPTVWRQRDVLWMVNECSFVLLKNWYKDGSVVLTDSFQGSSDRI